LRIARELTGAVRRYGARQAAAMAVAEAHQRVVRQPLRRSWSQHGEDVLIDRLLGHPRAGFYVDVGAYDPTRFSNTARFYRRGWRGINVEPNPARFRRVAAARPRDVNLNLGLGREAGERPFYLLEPETLSTFSADEASGFVAQGAARLLEETTLPIETLAAIMRAHDAPAAPEFLSVDVEGLELEVLEGGDWDRYRPRVVCVEAVAYGSRPGPPEGPVHEFLVEAGYRVAHTTALNRLYVRAA
jgi:FkbM family methyltransferase